MIDDLAKRLKAWGKWYDAQMLAALPKWARDTVKKELNKMTPKAIEEPQVFIVGREHSRKEDEFVYLAEEVRHDAPLSTTGIKDNAHRFTDPSAAERSATIANARGHGHFEVGLPEQFRSDITASQREAYKQHKLEEARKHKMQEIASTGVSGKELTPFAKKYLSLSDEQRCRGIDDALKSEIHNIEAAAEFDAKIKDPRAALAAQDMEVDVKRAAANKLDGAKILNREDLDKIFEPYNAEHVEVNAIVERPAHYNQGAIDVIEALYQLLTWEQFKGFMQGNIIKYTVRFEDKDNPIIDLEKAEYYSKRLREYRMRHREAELADKAKDWGIK